MVESTYFVHISDTHFGTTKNYDRHGHASYPCAKKLVDIINHLPKKPDFVIHTGDVVTDPSPEAYVLASEVFSELTVPIYYVVGNHDTAQDIKKYLLMGEREDLDSEDKLSYRFEVNGFRFLVIDARGPDEIDPQGVLSDSQLAVVKAEVEGSDPLIIFTHYPTLPLDSPWFDENMLIVNGEALHQTLVSAQDCIRGVFFGHIHQPTQTMRDGIVYTSTASAFSQFSAWPNALELSSDSDYLPGFSFVHLLPNQTIVHHHTFPRPLE